MKKIGILFGINLYAETEDEEIVKQIEHYIKQLEARERRVRNKEIELDLIKRH